MPLPESIATELEVIDAALAGEAVAPEFAELAELTLLLADARPAMPADAAERLDRRVSALASAPDRRRVPKPRRSWVLRPAFGAGLGLAAALVVVVIVLAGTGGGSRSTGDLNGPLAASTTAASAPAVNPNASSVSGSSAATSSAATSSAAGSSSQSASGGAGLGNLSPSKQTASAPASAQSVPNRSGTLDAIPTPQSNGRRIVESAQLTLTTPDARIATVAQELFSVVGAEAGIVKHSQVNSGSAGSASFTLSIPTANLSTTLNRLSQLRYAHVSSSTESSSDVNSQYLDDARALKDAKTLRSSLLSQLAAATTTADIDSLKAQIQDAEATIAADEAKVNALQGRISFTSVGVQIDAGSALPGPPRPSHPGFTISRAAHDALRVLTVAGGVVLIALAVLVPLGIIVGLILWVRSGWRRRGRERALDGA